jgi:hypothetical protein
MNVTTMNNINHKLLQQTTCKFKMAKCNWNVVKLDNSHNVWGWKKQDFFLWFECEQSFNIDN